jgi:hypothetical protein
MEIAKDQALSAYVGGRDRSIREFAKQILDTLAPGQTPRGIVGKLDPNKCPYRGHGSYDRSQSRSFFGRESEIERVTRSICESVDNAVTSGGNANKRLIFVYGPSGTGKSSLIASGVLPKLAELDVIPNLGSEFHIVLQKDGSAPLRPRDMDKTFEDYAKEAGDRPCLIAIDQFEEVWPEYDKPVPPALKSIVNNIPFALKSFRKLAIVLCFREEYLAKMQTEFGKVKHFWNPEPISGLSMEAAEHCIRGPALLLGIHYTDELVAALVNQLAAQNQPDAGSERENFVEPVQLQIVCERLWKELEPGIETIHSSDLRDVCRKMDLIPSDSSTEGVDTLAEIFVTYVTVGFLESAVESISKKDAAKACRYDDTERIYFALLQFVGEAQKRESLKVHKEAGGDWVGRLPITIVNELTNEHLLRASRVRNETEFELIHDRLVGPVVKKRDKLGLLYAVNSLDSAMAKVRRERKDLNGWFENYEPLIKDLTEFKKFEGLKVEEAEFVLRSALVYPAQKHSDLVDWGETVAAQHPSVLARVLKDAYCIRPAEQGGQKVKEEEKQVRGLQEARVRVNASILLREKSLQARLGREVLEELLIDLEAVCRTTKDDAQLEEMCLTLASCVHRETGDPPCDHLESILAEAGERARISSRNLLWMRDKVDMDVGGCFVRYWKSLPVIVRGWLTMRLYLLRLKQASVRMTFVVIITSIITGCGAAMMYAIWALSGSSFTQQTTSHGTGVGLFHGFFGGIVWGFSLSLATLFYWLILRGRRIKNTLSHWINGVILTGIAGLLAGLILISLLTTVYELQSKIAAGWLQPGSLDGPAGLFGFTDGGTGAGWIFPIYGFFLGLGVGWSMLSLYHDGKFQEFVSELGKEPTDRQLKTGKQLSNWASKILWRVFLKSAPVAFAMLLAGIVTFNLYSNKNKFTNGNLDCAPRQWSRPSRCNVAEKTGDEVTEGNPIAPLEWRATGTSVIIYFGAYSLISGYLLALLTIRFGVEVPEDKSFLGGLGSDV